jgi:hypothetical protein
MNSSRPVMNTVTTMSNSERIAEALAYANKFYEIRWLKLSKSQQRKQTPDDVRVMLYREFILHNR